MGILGKILAAPIRVLDIPNKIMKAVVEDDSQEPSILDRVSDAVEKQVDEIVGD